jgi:hypothetical protein
MEASTEIIDGYLNIWALQRNFDSCLFDSYTLEELDAALTKVKKEDFVEIFYECFSDQAEDEPICLEPVSIAFYDIDGTPIVVRGSGFAWLIHNDNTRISVKLTVCHLTVRGLSPDLIRFDRDFEKNGDGYSINNLYPAPAGLDDNEAYLWKNSNIGTPWDMTVCGVSKENDRFDYVFIIGFDAPMGAVTEASKKYLSLDFTMKYGPFTEENKVRIVNGKTVFID